MASRSAAAPGCDFSGADLRNAHLVHTDFRGCRYDRARLDCAYLNRSNLIGASFTDAVLAPYFRCDGSDLRDTAWRGADLQGARFLRTDLRGVSFAGADLRRVRFEMCDLRNADLSGARCDGASFPESKTLGINWSGDGRLS